MSDYQLFWGDIHNHNEVGYGQGGLNRSYEIAASHLDFYAFTPHSQMADGTASSTYPVVVDNGEAVQQAAGDYALDDTGPGFYYLRVTQENGQMAWSSPIWIE